MTWWWEFEGPLVSDVSPLSCVLHVEMHGYTAFYYPLADNMSIHHCQDGSVGLRSLGTLVFRSIRL